MSKKVKLKQPLLIQKPSSQLSAPQKCKIPQSLDFPASSLVIFKSKSRRFLCRLYYLTEVYDDKSIAYVDDSVELNPQRKSRREEIKFIEEIETVPDYCVEFKLIKVHLHLNHNNLDLEVIREEADLIQLTLSIIKHYKFTSDCEISCNRGGISKIFVLLTDCDGFGSVNQSTQIEIIKISIDSQTSLGQNQLGGLKEAENQLSHVIATNINFNSHPDQFTFTPNSQVLIIGPVGTGKTSLVHHVARKLDCIVFEITGDIFQPLPGETEAQLMKLFDKIQKIRKIVSGQAILVLIENIEIFCPKFNPKMKENSHCSRVSSLLFSLLDEFASLLVVVATTSKLEALNDTVRRKSGCEIVLDMPNEAQRREILKVLCEDHEDVIENVAQSTPGFVGADLEVLCQFVARSLTENFNLQDAFNLALKSITPSVLRENLGFVTRSTMKLSDIGGMEKLKKSLLTSILGPLRHPEQFKKLGLRSPSGILLYGPSGCAKTTIVKCLAGEAKMTLISVSSAEIYSPYVGEAEKFLVKLFNQARMNSPAILFFDEIDTIVGNRAISSGGSDAHTRILSTLLTEIDGFASGSRKTVLIIGATNKPEMIDDALMRPGRFDKLIHVPAPDHAARVSILNFIAKKMPISSEVNIEDLAKRTENFSGADLVNLCNEAAMCAATKDLQSDLITKEDFEEVFLYLGPSLRRQQIDFYKNFENLHRRKV